MDIEALKSLLSAVRAHESRRRIVIFGSSALLVSLAGATPAELGVETTLDADLLLDPFIRVPSCPFVIEPHRLVSRRVSHHAVSKGGVAGHDEPGLAGVAGDGKPGPSDIPRSTSGIFAATSRT